MTTHTKTAKCRKCGATFTASATGYTVHCPLHRGREVATTATTRAFKPFACRCGRTIITGPEVECPYACHRATYTGPILPRA